MRFIILRSQVQILSSQALHPPFKLGLGFRIPARLLVCILALSLSRLLGIAFFLVLFRFQSLSLVIVFRKGCVNWARRRVLASSTSRGSGVAGNRDWGLASAYANSSLVERPFIEFLGSVASVGPSFLM